MTTKYVSRDMCDEKSKNMVEKIDILNTKVDRIERELEIIKIAQTRYVGITIGAVSVIMPIINYLMRVI